MTTLTDSFTVGRSVHAPDRAKIAYNNSGDTTYYKFGCAYARSKRYGLGGRLSAPGGGGSVPVNQSPAVSEGDIAHCTYLYLYSN